MVLEFVGWGGDVGCDVEFVEVYFYFIVCVDVDGVVVVEVVGGWVGDG